MGGNSITKEWRTETSKKGGGKKDGRGERKIKRGFGGRVPRGGVT